MTLPTGFLTKPLAHRGLHDLAGGVPENGMTAFRRAVAGGFGIELDLQVSADGVAMAFHDNTLDRMTDETGPVRDRTAVALGQITLANSGDTISTLAEVAAEVAGRAPLLIELKDQSGGKGGSDGALEAGVADALAGYGGPVALMSFNPDQVARLAEVMPDAPRGLTTSNFEPDDWPGIPDVVAAYLRGIPDLDRVGGSFISHDVRNLDMPRIAELKEQGLPVLCWTVRSPAAEHNARKIANNITFEGYLPEMPQ